ncbi:RNA-directed DNA polymerase, eukaryota, reverse transcriptase zinc-binding domain protein [Tanacetum coccineum]
MSSKSARQRNLVLGKGFIPDEMHNDDRKLWSSKLTPKVSCLGKVFITDEKLHVTQLCQQSARQRYLVLGKGFIADEIWEGITRNQAFGKIYEETYREELIKINSIQIEKQKVEVELFFYSEEVLTEEIRNTWTDEMVMQYEGLMGEKVNKIMNKSLLGSQMECLDDEVAEDMSGIAKFMARNEVSDVVDGNDAEMQETQLRKKVVNKVCNEVFGAWDWVSNSVDSKKGCRIAVGWDPAVFRPMLISQTSQVMHFLVKRNMDNKDIYVSFVYGEINAMGRRELWKTLKDFNNIAGNFPWVLLGDFNVILSYNENSRGIRINNMGVYEFRDCAEFLNIEDVKITGLFFTWIQKRRDPNNGILKKLDRVMGNGKFVDAYVNAFANFLPFGVSDHSPAVLVFPEVKSRKNRAFRFLNYLTEKKEFITIVRDNWNVNVKGYAMFILAKRLKFLKKHMRDLNKRNGDVCEKVKSLKIELDRIQEALSNDPSSVHLREDELVFAEAYRRAVSDEELLLKQKSKIQWLKEGDFNTKFVDHFKKFFGKCDVVYPIEDHENLFTKKLDPETAEELVKPVSDDEIKMALFDIEDNKASGPDGYTSKFFKSAWSVVGKDTCSAVKEFFSSGKLLGEFNASIISLIPKVVVPKKVIDYRTIRCCNVVYKTISKVITNRLKGVLSGLVGENQSAFIPGRQISDNILLTQEFMRGYQWNVGQRASRCAFKIDIQKAYDTVNWKFLEFILKCSWFLQGGKGVETGGSYLPLSLHIGHGGPKSDDQKTCLSASVLRRGLDDFCLCSGLLPSMSKSEAFFGNVSSSVKADIGLVMPFKEGVLPIKYLGVPMVSKRITDRDCKVMVEVIRKRVGIGEINPSLLLAALLAKHIWNIVSRKDSLWVKWVNVYKLKGRSMWDIELDRGSWKSLVDLRSRIERFVQVKIGNGLKLSVNDMIEGNEWVWPIKWDDRFKEVTNVPVLNLRPDVEDKTGNLRLLIESLDGLILRAWLWERLKPLAKLEGISNDWACVISFIFNKPATNTIWSIIQRDVECLYKNIVDIIIMKLMGLAMKCSPDVLAAASIWNFKINKSDYYRRMVEELLKEDIFNGT